MTVDLGYASLLLHAAEIELIDVPGHRDYIDNALRGFGQAGAALLVVSASEGPRPQTIEHMRHLAGLGVRRGVIALSKADLVDGSRLTELRRMIGGLTAGTPLGDWSVVVTSAHTGAGIGALRRELSKIAVRSPRTAPESDGQRLWMWVDRAFSAAGRGLVVTGTVMQGTITVGSRVHILPAHTGVRVREVQRHGETVSWAAAPCRVGINLVGANDPVQRGFVISGGGAGVAGDSWLGLVERDRVGGAGEEVVLHIGSAVVPARWWPVGHVDTGMVVIRPRSAVATRLPARAVVHRSSDPACVPIRIVDELSGVSMRLLRRSLAMSTLAISSDSELARPAVYAGLLAAARGIVSPQTKVTHGLPDGLADHPGVFRMVGPWIFSEDAYSRLLRKVLERVGAGDGRALVQSVVAAGSADIKVPALLGSQERLAATSVFVDSLVERRLIIRVRDELSVPNRERVSSLLAALDVDAPQLLASLSTEIRLTAADLEAARSEGPLVDVGSGVSYLGPRLEVLVERIVREAELGPVTPSQAASSLGVGRRHAILVLEHADRLRLTVRSREGHRARAIGSEQAPQPGAGRRPFSGGMET